MTSLAVPSTPRQRCRARSDLAGRARLSRLCWSTAAGIGGLGLALLLSGCFSAPPQIISLEPNRGSTSVAADAAVRVVFDKPVARASVDGRFSVDVPLPGCDLGVALHAPPTAACWVRWLPGNLGFELLHRGAVFAPATRYVFTLAGGFVAVTGDVNGLDHHWDLTSAAAPRVAAITPGDGSTSVPVDGQLAVGFSGPMDAPSTAAAITLQPSVPGTRVVRNLSDRTRFVLLPGQLLDPGIAYTISVSGAARGEDNQAVAAPLDARFVTGTRLATGHAAVLAGRPGEAATELLLPALGAGPGDPTATPVVLRAGRCAATSCGAVPMLAPLQTYGAAAVAADGAHVAVVVNDLTSVPSRSSLEVIDTATDAVAGSFANAQRGSWSPTGRLLAFASGGDIVVFSPGSGRLSTVATSTQLVAAPLWSGDTTLVLSTAPASGSRAGIELVDLVLGARYDLPGAASASVIAAVSPGGTQLAAQTPSGVVILPIGGAGGSGQRLPGRLDVLGFTGEGAVLGVSKGSEEQLVRLNLAGGESTPVRIDIGLVRMGSVRLAADGRRLAFLATDANGATQAYVANADGTGALALTRLLPGGEEAQSVDFAT